jgi:DNA-binding cell septation regulator SpoVG
MTDVPHIEVIDFELLHNASALKAIATIQYDDTTVYDVRVIHSPGKPPWVSPPQREYYQGSQRKWAPQVKWARPLANAISAAVLEAYEEATRPYVYRLPVPPCLAVLDLSLPCTADDVKQAYRQKARITHPDAGGDAAEFRAVREAYDEALRLVGGMR